MKDPYSVLGVSRDVSPEDLKKSYRALSKEWHPDKHKGDKTAEDKFKEINEAYSILSDPQKKQQYDQFGSTGGQGGGFGGFDFSGFQGGNMPDLEDLFGSFFGGGRRNQRPSGRGDDLEGTVDVTLEEVLAGTERTLRVRRFVACDTCEGKGAEPGSAVKTCDECGGTGVVTKRTSSLFGTVEQRVRCGNCGGSGRVPEKKCTTCDGEGRVQKTDELTVRIPEGVNDGQTLRVTGKGGAGRQGEEAGDLYVHVRVRRDERFERDDADIHSALKIHVLQALLGDTIEIETLHGQMKLVIPEGTQHGQVLRIKGKGLPVLGSSKVGNHDVHIEIDIPKKLSRAERKIVEEWKEQRG